MKTRKLELDGKTYQVKENFSDMNCSEKQEIAELIVRYTGGSYCMSSEIDYILRMSWEDMNAPYSWDEVSNYFAYADYSGSSTEGFEERVSHEMAQEYIAELEEKQSELDIDDDNSPDWEQYNELQEEIDELENLSFDSYPEIISWFLLDERLIYRLDKMGECTLANCYWGRECGGQSIYLDYCIQKVCHDLAICWSE